MADTSTEVSSNLPQHVLLVEDNMIIALDTEEMLEQIGIERVDVESNAYDAIAAIRRTSPDFAILDYNLGDESCAPVAGELSARFAILDYNLGDESCAPVAGELSARGVPFILATGHSKDFRTLGELGAVDLMTKPYTRAAIEQALTRAASG